ncbi:MAG: hypothetical protein ACRCSF_10165 [Mycobacteriaceae bacterium]
MSNLEKSSIEKVKDLVLGDSFHYGEFELGWVHSHAMKFFGPEEIRVAVLQIVESLLREKLTEIRIYAGKVGDISRWTTDIDESLALINEKYLIVDSLEWDYMCWMINTELGNERARLAEPETC